MRRAEKDGVAIEFPEYVDGTADDAKNTVCRVSLSEEDLSVVENRPRNATARAASEVEVEIFTPTEFLDHIASSPRAARELIERLSQRLREADDRIVNDERRSGRAHGTRTDADSHTAVASVNNAYLAAKSPWLQRQFHTPLGLGDHPFVVGRGPVAREGLERLQESEPDLILLDLMMPEMGWFPVDPPPLKWSDLRYVFDIKEDCNGKEAIQA